VQLTDKSREDLLNAKTDLPFTEVKWEAAIDRVTSAATPRQIERVPAGAVFGPMELVFSVFFKEDIVLLGNLLTAFQLLEDDYLGGQGSRGSGKIAFRNLTIEARQGKEYATVPTDARFKAKSLEDLLKAKPDLLAWAKNLFPA
jgi:CRISPR-associated protein Csm3